MKIRDGSPIMEMKIIDRVAEGHGTIAQEDVDFIIKGGWEIVYLKIEQHPGQWGHGSPSIYVLQLRRMVYKEDKPQEPNWLFGEEK
jgi:hypothetical protein